jgi:hypothetical protein
MERQIYQGDMKDKKGNRTRRDEPEVRMTIERLKPRKFKEESIREVLRSMEDVLYYLTHELGKPKIHISGSLTLWRMKRSTFARNQSDSPTKTNDHG